jgi:hypothetical protein
MNKRKHRRSWRQISEHCADRDYCECGYSILCRNSDIGNECEKENCPKWTKFLKKKHEKKTS